MKVMIQTEYFSDIINYRYIFFLIVTKSLIKLITTPFQLTIINYKFVLMPKYKLTTIFGKRYRDLIVFGKTF